MLAILSLAELLGMSPWFAASAVSPQLRELWGLGTSQAAWLTAVVQLGFVAGTLCAAVLNLADVVRSRLYFAAAASLAALANLGLGAAGGLGVALLLRFLTGFFLAGVYPPAMKMAATWFRSSRGLAIGTIVGALTVGKALPYLADAIGGAYWQNVIYVTSGAAAASAIVVGMVYRDGPYAFTRRAFSWALVGKLLRVREFRLATGGYLGHMWELYAFWTWIAAFFAASAEAASGGGAAPATEMLVKILAFGAIAVGGLGCVWGGRVADRIGYESLVIRALAASGACALLVGFFFGKGPWLLFAVACVWGFFVIADSAQFSTLVTLVVPDHAVGTALTIQTSLGFLLTMVTIQLVPLISLASGWQWAFPVLAAGPAFGMASIARLRRVRAERRAVLLSSPGGSSASP